MLAKLQITFEKPNNDFSFHSGSLFHGALMQLVDRDFAAEMHNESIRPYSQNITYSDERIFSIYLRTPYGDGNKLRVGYHTHSLPETVT